MAISRKAEARALSAEERTLIERSHHPDLQALPDEELASLTRLVRERRDRARTLARQQRRELRGKGEPRGSSPARGDEGAKLKQSILAMAMRRLNNEGQRRRRMAARGSLVETARNALALKQASDQPAPDWNSRHAHEGMRNIARERRQNLIRPMERGRLRKAYAAAQAKRDAR